MSLATSLPRRHAGCIFLIAVMESQVVWLLYSKLLLCCHIKRYTTGEFPDPNNLWQISRGSFVTTMWEINSVQREQKTLGWKCDDIILYASRRRASSWPGLRGIL